VAVCRLAANLPVTPVARHVAGQITRCATSPLANYAEVQSAESRRDFVHKLQLCLKELRETRGWLKLIPQLQLETTQALDGALRECGELIAIVTSVRTAKGIGRERAK
jgi:four helix bundle protein